MLAASAKVADDVSGPEGHPDEHTAQNRARLGAYGLTGGRGDVDDAPGVRVGEELRAVEPLGAAGGKRRGAGRGDRARVTARIRERHGQRRVARVGDDDLVLDALAG